MVAVDFDYLFFIALFLSSLQEARLPVVALHPQSRSLSSSHYSLKISVRLFFFCSLIAKNTPFLLIVTNF